MTIKKFLPHTIIGLSLVLSGCFDKSENTAVNDDAPAAAEQAAEQAEASTTPEPKARLAAQRTAVLNATVDSINHETRAVTILDPNDQPLTFTASDEVRNLDQVKAGDSINVEYVQSIDVQLIAIENVQPIEAGVSAMDRAKEGDMPGVKAISKSVTVTTVEEINIEANTFKLKNSDGEVNEYVARNPENLKKAEVGDAVVITVVEAIAAFVTEAPAETVNAE